MQYTSQRQYKAKYTSTQYIVRKTKQNKAKSKNKKITKINTNTKLLKQKKEWLHITHTEKGISNTG